ncbi:DUF3786 domain-containing protein [Desulfobacterota bacterium M19]
MRNPLEIYKILPKTNCGKCLLPSCLAFSAAVVEGRKKLRDCPELGSALSEELSADIPSLATPEFEQAEFMDKLQDKVASVDFQALAPLIGAVVKDDSLVVNSLGKDFMVRRQGTLVSECHINPWVQAPLLSYITSKNHAEITGRWISLREIKGGVDWQGLFTSRCEMPLRKLADDNPHLLEDIIELFAGREVEWYQADIALILYPLPKFPILICYQSPEDDLESLLTIFFDECCAVNLQIKSIFTLCAGLVRMFTKIAEHHM